MKNTLLALSLCLALPLLGGCAISQEEAAAKAWQRAECNKILDKDDQERCLKRL